MHSVCVCVWSMHVCVCVCVCVSGWVGVWVRGRVRDRVKYVMHLLWHYNDVDCFGIGPFEDKHFANKKL